MEKKQCAGYLFYIFYEWPGHSKDCNYNPVSVYKNIIGVLNFLPDSRVSVSSSNSACWRLCRGPAYRARRTVRTAGRVAETRKVQRVISSKLETRN
jgi:hypothetical protein